MHSMIMVYGPDTQEKLDKVMEQFGQETAPVKMRTLADFSMHEVDVTFRVIHDIIKERLKFPYPKYLIVNKEHLQYMEFRDFVMGDVDVVLTYADDKLHTLHYLYMDILWDWYMVGGRWFNKLHPKWNGGVYTDIIHGDRSWVMPGDITEESHGCNSLRLKDVDFETMVKNHVNTYLHQHQLLQEKYPEAKSFDYFVELMKLPDDCGWFDMTHAYDLFYKQFVDKIPNDIWAVFTVAGRTQDEVKELAELFVYCGENAIIDSKLYSKEKNFGLLDLPTLRHVKETVLALDPETVVTVVDIHN